MFKRIDHFEIIPENFEKTINFYTEILGFKTKERLKLPPGMPFREIVFLSLGDTMIEVLDYVSKAPMAKEPQVGYRMLAIEVDNMDSTIKYLKEKGVALTWGPMAAGKSIRAEIVDPSGLGIELRQW